MLPRIWKAFVAYGREYTRFSRNARLYLLSFFFSGFAFSGYILFFNFYLRSLHYDEGTIGLLNAIPSVCGVLFAIPAGYLGDRIGRKQMLIAGTLLDLIGFICFSLSSNLVFLTLALFLSSFGFTLRWTLAAPFMADNSRVEDRTQLFSLQFALGTMTNFVGSVVGGFLPRIFAGILGVKPDSTEALRATLLVSGATLAISLLPLLFLVELPRPVAQVKAGQKAKRRVLPRDPSLVLRLMLPEILLGIGAGMTIPFLNVYISAKFGVEFETLGLLFGFADLSTTLAIFIQPLLARRFGKVRSVVIFQALSLPFLVMLGFGPFFWMAAIALYIRGALMQAANPVYQVFIQEQVPQDERATASALLGIADNLSRGTGSTFSGFLRGAVGSTAGFNVLFGLMIGCYISSIATFYFSFRHKDKEPILPEETQTESVIAPATVLQEVG